MQPMQTKKYKKKSGLYFRFLFLNWKVLSSKSFTVFFKYQIFRSYLQKKFHRDLECLQMCQSFTTLIKASAVVALHIALFYV